MTRTFVVDRHALAETSWVESSPAPLDDGGVRIGIDSFALTANNITYAAFGDAMQYWQFFPTGDCSTGCIPVWGFGVVSESRCAGIDVGERIYGFFPMASDVVLQPVGLTTSSFIDGASHRRALHPVYNHYRRCAADPDYQPSREAEQALLRPLFTTSFLIDDFFDDQKSFSATSVILSSASSKTAYGTAFLMARRSRGDASALRLIGLTSTSNLAFTRSLGCYDEVLAYADLRMLAADMRTAFVDFSGNAENRAVLHRHFGDRLVYSCSVGGTHWSSLGSGKGLPGPRPVLFFAPAQAKKRSTDWGSAELQRRIARAWAAFIERVADPIDPWMRVIRGRGQSSVTLVYADLLAGRTNPRLGHLLAV